LIDFEAIKTIGYRLMARKLRFESGGIPSYYILNRDLGDGKHIYYDAVIYCDRYRYRCIFSQEIMDKLGCNVYIRAHFADMLIYDIYTKSIDLRDIRDLCNLCKRYEMA